MSERGFPSTHPASTHSLPQVLIQSLLPNKHVTCQLCLREKIPGQLAHHKRTACVFTVSLDSTYFPNLILHKTYTSLCIRQPDLGIFCDKRETTGELGKAKKEAKCPILQRAGREGQILHRLGVGGSFQGVIDGSI